MVIKQVEIKNDEGKAFNVEVYLNGRSLKQIEKEVKEIDPKMNVWSAIDNFARTKDFIYMSIILGAAVHEKGNKYPVGADWFDDNEISFFGNDMASLILALNSCFTDLYPTKTGK